ncbi:203_t:CDS:2, partial [Scutellospora calospora]
IGTSKGKEKASDSGNSVRQIGSNSGGQNESVNTDKDKKKVLHQMYFLTPKFKKNLIYNSPANKYQEFTNVHIYSIMMKMGNNTSNHAKACNEATQEWNKIKTKNALEIDDIIKKYLNTSFNLYNIQTVKSRYIPEKTLEPSLPTIYSVEPVSKVSANTAAQKKAFKHDTYIKISNLQTQIRANKDRIAKLKRNAKYTQNCREKKKILIENHEVINYDSSGHSPLLFQYSNLHNYIYKSVEFGSADEKHIYMARTILDNYLLSRQSNSITTKAHHYLAWILVAGVSCTDTHEHPNSHYCLASVKCAKQFASVFSDMSVVISQDNKAKIADHDFVIGFKQKLVPSSLGTSSLTHIQYLDNLTIDSQYDSILKTGREIQPIWFYYLTIRTHASEQSKYNPVERGMTILS